MNPDCKNLTPHEIWQQLLATPENYTFTPGLTPVKNYRFADFDAELYIQNNAPGNRTQRVLKVLPKQFTAPAPAVAIPFYFPEAMIGFELESGEILPNYSKITMMADLARRGFITISADAYHLTYNQDDDAPRDDFYRWSRAGEALRKDYPGWNGMGKLLADTRLLLDALEADPRVDKDKLGIAGHSLGGKMAFYTGCMDQRIKAFLASDFGIGWDQTNYQDVWYWHDQVEELKKIGLDHSQLLDFAAGKPFMLIAGLYDNEESGKIMHSSQAYSTCPENLVLLNHATGHRPPPEALNAGYDFLEKFLKSSR